MTHLSEVFIGSLIVTQPASILLTFIVDLAAASASATPTAWMLARPQGPPPEDASVVGRFRHLFEHSGGVCRQHFFAVDREVLLNPSQRLASTGQRSPELTR
jgi:hypothetical protein